MSKKGFTLIELMIVVAIIGILALIAIPNFLTLRQRAYNASAQSAGRNARLSEEVYYQNTGGDVDGGYTNSLITLLLYDKNLTDDPLVTFAFTSATVSSYTYTTRHKKGSSTFTWIN
jgi:prepilin-type N-terminal cleavage/methylation domain-containing protein